MIEELYKSILFCKEPFDLKERKRDEKKFSREMLTDLNMNQLIYSVSNGRNREFIEALLQTPLNDPEEVYFRQAVFRDLECEALRNGVFSLVGTLEHVEEKLASLEKLVNEEQKEALFLNVVNKYCNAINDFYEVLKKVSLKSDGFKMVLTCFEKYVTSDFYHVMNEENQLFVKRLSEISYNIIFQDGDIIITNAGKREDFNTELLGLFQPFLTEGKRSGYCRKVTRGIDMNPVEISIMECVKKMNPEVFKQIHGFRKKYSGFYDEFVKRFCEEAQFYISYLKYTTPLLERKKSFSHTQFVDNMEQTKIEDGYDLILGIKLLNGDAEIVPNDLECLENERVFIITGPNQGGKTTFSRMLGQIYYLSMLGVPVPARKVSIVFPKGIFTHFEHEEVAYHDNGKLQDDLLRMRDILNNATENCLIIMNEMLSSTSYKDALQIGKKIIEKLEQTNNISIYVTFVDELSKLSGKVVSLVSMVESSEHTKRTYKMKRNPANGVVYAKSLADKYDLSYQKIRIRLCKNG